MVDTEQESDRRRREEKLADLLVLPRPAKSLQNGTGFSRETWAYLACWKGKSGIDAQREQLTSRLEPSLQKRKKKQSRQSKVPDCKGEESQGE